MRAAVLTEVNQPLEILDVDVDIRSSKMLTPNPVGLPPKMKSRKSEI